MGFRIATNVPSISSQRYLKQTTQRLQDAQERLSSGFRINKAADDAAGLAISEKQGSEIRALAQAKRNANDGISLIQTAEGGLNEITNILARLKELSVQAASDSISDLERGFLQKEFGALKDEVDRIATSAEFNGNLLLIGQSPLPPAPPFRGNIPPLEIQVGPSYHQVIDGPEIRNPTNIIRIDLQNMNALTEGPGSLDIGSATNPEGTRIDTKHAAQLSIERINNALDLVNGYRADLGATENRLGHSINNLSIRIENLSAAKSRIKDADFADQSAALTSATILQQAGVSMLAQANQAPQLALKLIQGM